MTKPTFHLTGFGKFAGVEDNPSKRIIEIIQKDPSILNTQLYKLGSAKVLEVSAKAVQEYFQSIQCNPNEPTLFVHFGVDASATQYCIEMRAKNEASFRAPDEQKYQPLNERIINSQPIDHFLYTTIPVKQICANLNLTLPKIHSSVKVVTFDKSVPTKDPKGTDEKNNESQQLTEKLSKQLVEVSDDAGRFVCNYIYYQSLNFCKNVSGTQSVFIHIPSHQTISIQEQIKFVKELLDELAKCFQ